MVVSLNSRLESNKEEEEEIESGGLAQALQSSAEKLELVPVLNYSQGYGWVIQKSMSLKYEPSSEPLHISAVLLRARANREQLKTF